MSCILCNHEETILSCPNCKASYPYNWESLAPADYATKYEELYPGMQVWCQKLKDAPDFMEQIANRGEPYTKVVNYLKALTQPLKILEVGCGWGYLTYGLRRLGFDAEGIDISPQAIYFALETYGQHYRTQDIYSVKYNADIIVAVEVFEHLRYPLLWLQRCLQIAPKVVITTPNLVNGNWISENPPVHMACYRKESLEWLAKELGVKVDIEGSNNLFAIFHA